MKRLSHVRLTPLLCLLFLLPVHATETRIIEGSLRDQYFLKSLKEKEREKDIKRDCCAQILHRPTIHPHILNDCGLLVIGYIERKVSKNIVVPRDFYGILVKYLAGDLDKNHFDKICFIHNDTGAFIGWVPYAADKSVGVYRVNTFQVRFCRDLQLVQCSNLLVCKEFKTQYGRSGRDKNGYDNGGYDIDGYDRRGYDRTGYDKDVYNKWGYDRCGYDKWGDTQTVLGYPGHNLMPSSGAAYDENGYDREGYDRAGYNKRGDNRAGYNREGYDGYGYGRHGYGRDGYNREGYDRHGYNKEGYDENGFDIRLYDRWGYDTGGYNKDGYGKDGYNREGYDREGYDRDGYNEAGYNRNGYNIDGYNRYGYDRYGRDRYGYDKV